MVELWSIPRVERAAAAHLGGGRRPDRRPETCFTCKSAVWSVALTLTLSLPLSLPLPLPLTLPLTLTLSRSVALTPTGDTLAVGTSMHTEVYALARSAYRPAQDATSEPKPPTSPNTPPSSPGRPHGPRADALVSYEPLLFLECPAHQGGVAFSVSRHAEKIVPRSRESFCRSSGAPGQSAVSRLSGRRPSVGGSGAGMTLAAAAMAAAVAAAGSAARSAMAEAEGAVPG